MKSDMVDNLINRTDAIKNIDNLNLKAYVGSGFNIKITDLDENEIVDTQMGLTLKSEFASAELMFEQLRAVLSDNLHFNVTYLEHYISDAKAVLNIQKEEIK